ncbi:MAG: tRNA (adenosine(37)-N6)-threonylcarbamoyltransferase complex transferase subunit TsaD [Deltaproteobacteria bacterium]|nr:tRNA (adenosine(37)-N6)-threonylcarbamoyltransferase complex transferase subunit TsaD [Deltaproteobacteria bacterium]
MIVLGLESSCDETAAALCQGPLVLSEVVRSQTDLHKIYGGVVPEIASRAHLESVEAIVAEALERASLKLGDVGGLAVTQGPGLVGALMVALSFAKGLIISSKLPAAGVNHVQAHALAPFLYAKGEPPASPPSFPLAALVASGGHTSLFLAEGPLRFKLLGRTLDDAAGEAFDKVAKLMGLGYPGGRAIEELAKDGDPEAFKIARPLWRKGLDFSFSGLKTRVGDLYRQYRMDSEREGSKALKDLAASFQAAAVDVLVDKLKSAALDSKVETAVLSGGVAANMELRRKAREALEPEGLVIRAPRLSWCADNGAMIAYLGSFQLEAGRSLLSLSAEARPRWPVGQ